MADERKEKKKGPVSSNDGVERALEVIFVFFLIAYILSGIGNYFGQNHFFSNLFSGSLFAKERPLQTGFLNSPVGSRVLLLAGADVYSDPGGGVVGARPANTGGTVISGPEWQDGRRYWQIRFDDGTESWVAEKSLTGGDGQVFNPGATPVGNRVVTARDAQFYEIAGGRTAGVEKKGAAGLITKGPIDIGGSRYWFVEFDDGKSGFVNERDLNTPAGNPLAVRLLAALRFLSTVISLLFLTGIIYSVIMLTVLRNAEAHKYSIVKPAVLPISDEVDPRWKKITDHLDSENPNDWRLAIMEADIILDEMLKRMGYHGDTVGERLRSVEESDFTSINIAWEAHKVRNLIAHQGSDFLITQREAKRVIGLYKQVFEEFHMHVR